jgi:hypothetical protein
MEKHSQIWKRLIARIWYAVGQLVEALCYAHSFIPCTVNKPIGYRICNDTNIIRIK